MTWNRVLMDKREDELDLSDGEEKHTEGEKEESKEREKENSEERQTPSFNHPSLKGKSPEEIEALFTAQSLAVKEQGRRLSQLESERQTPFKEEPKKEEEKAPSAAEIWANPSLLVDEITKRVRSDLAREIEPFKRDAAASRSQGAWGRLEGEYDDVESLRPLMEELLTASKIDTPTIDTLRTIRYIAIGKMRDEGREPVRRERENGTPSGRKVNPQHPPSSQPLARGGENKPPRKLTESEKSVARLQGLSDAEYLKWLEADEDDILTPEVKK